MTKPQWAALHHFTSDEFDSPDKLGSGAAMEYDFMRALDAARRRAGFPFFINSGFRTPKHNKAIGGRKNSAHLRGWAGDIDLVRLAKELGTTVTAVRPRLLEALQFAGFNRIGIYRTFIHADMDPSLPPNVIWVEGE